MHDLRRLLWVKEILEFVAWITSETRVKTKPRLRIKDAIDKYNQNLCSEEPAQQSSSIEEVAIVEDEGDAIVCGLDGLDFIPPLSARAIMLRKPAKTRLASIESTLQAYVRCCIVVLSVV
ncbi:hypothetical protein BWQ96_04294 [Gracilariopsis chorda]|uniref:Uncharacterized protein n=1 Tax=Gracilariopsis chorda TaxID=448386 RepID=A0A2V3IUY9_9FLOR|nr:hypothetical protein BWQ96_04294 [Gracilariopsis chorda]|eukprot:PXF45933.1 hypothetical protein BWQ96_04294 [Gracilariopsis chorda]